MRHRRIQRSRSAAIGLMALLCLGAACALAQQAYPLDSGDRLRVTVHGRPDLSGTYTVGVNYYSGSSPEVATVQVAAGLEVRTFPIQLTDAVGSGGNDSPVRVADVIVSFDEVRGTYDFDIRAL